MRAAAAVVGHLEHQRGVEDLTVTRTTDASACLAALVSASLTT